MQVQLNKDQEKAVTHSGSPLLVAAGPGSGKTRVIVERVKHLIEKQGIKPSQILCLTFSDKAAEEMRNRIIEQANTAEVETATFHSFCLGILEDSVLETGVSFKSGLISRNNQLVWGLKNIDNFGFEYITIGNNAVEVIESIIDGISAFRDELVTPSELKEYLIKKKSELEQIQKTIGITSYTKKTKSKKKDNDEKSADNINEQIAFINRLIDLQKVYEKYEIFKRKESLIDYDDMLQVVIELFKNKQDVLKLYQDKYAHVLVDEFQDNNFAQLELVKLLCPFGNVTVVGDDDQSIYRFRGAYLTVFEDFIDHYKNVTTVNLERNYRSTKNIVSIAKQLLDPIPNRIKKNLHSENEDGDKTIIARCSTDLAEIDFVVKKIKELLGKEIVRRDGTKSPISYKDIAILSRRRFEGIKFARTIRSQGLPCTFVGESRIFSTPIIRDLLAYLRVANDPLSNGVEITRIMLNHGVTEQNVKIINHAANARNRELVKRIYKEEQESEIRSRSDDKDSSLNYGTDFVYDILQDIATKPDSIISKEITQKNLIVDIFDQIKKILDARTRRTVSEFVFDTMMSLTDIYKRTTKDDLPESGKDRLLLNEFLGITQDFEGIRKNATLKEFLEHIDLMSDFDIDIKQGENLSDSIMVTTIHKSKGQEFPIVFVVDVAAKKLPLVFREKKFYCPSELARGLKFKDMDESELYTQEERRLLYVAMTRAQYYLFLAYAEIYGDRVTKAKPSKFLLELDFENNSLVNMVSHDTEGAVSTLVTDSNVEQIKAEYQILASKLVDEMQLKAAIEKIVELAAILHYQKGKSLSEFNKEELLSNLSYDVKKLESELKQEKISLIDKDKIHFSASALKTYQDCPLKYKFSYVMKVPSSPKTYFDLGSSVHSVVEILTKKQIADLNYIPTKDEAMKLLDRYWVSSSYQNVTTENEDKASAEKMIDFFIKWVTEQKMSGNTPIAAEQEFEIDLAGKKLLGFIDRIEKTLTGEYEVYDYKTGKSELNGSTIKKDIQVNAYSIGIQKKLGKLPISVSLLYLRKEKRLPYQVTAESVDMVKQEMITLTDGILSERFPPTPDYFTCKYCDYQSICDAKEIDEEN